MPASTPLRGQRLEALLDRLPTRPGVYLMKDTRGRVVYVGKAKSLRTRVRSYFRASGDERAFVSRLHKVLGDIEVVVTPTEKDALLLERELIQRNHPRFNIDLKDNKNFLSILLSDDAPFPRLSHLRRPPRGEPAGRWFGPYTSAASARETFRMVQAVFQLRICRNAVFARRERPCLQYQMGRCLGPCVPGVAVDLYRQRVEGAVRALRGRTDALVDELTRRMKEASTGLRYEEAARYRDRIRMVQHTLARQQVVDERHADRDVLALFREGAAGVVLLMQVRRGRWIGASRFPFRRLESPDDDVVRQFLSQHYGSGADLPPEVLLPAEALRAGGGHDLEVLASWLSDRRGTRVHVRVPRRGRGARLVSMARENAAEAHRASLATADLLAERLERLKRRLHLARLPRRIECFDLSTLGGSLSVGSMAVLADGEPEPSAYRRYRIRDARPDSDVDMMREVLGRRFRTVLEGAEDGPDLVVLDGGKGQLGVVAALFADLGVTDVDLVALAKGRQTRGRTTERVFLVGRKNAIPLRPDSDELFLLSRVRDEAHRFAVAYHRKLRHKATLRSLLDEVPGVGPVLRKRLLRRFRSLRGVEAAGVDELVLTPGVSRPLAERIQAFLVERRSLTRAEGPDRDS